MNVPEFALIHHGLYVDGMEAPMATVKSKASLFAVIVIQILRSRQTATTVESAAITRES